MAHRDRIMLLTALPRADLIGQIVPRITASKGTEGHPRSMSLTALVRFRTPVRERMARDFPRPRLPLKAELRVPSHAPNRALLGTAFDYLFRFHIQRITRLAVTRPWVAEQAYELISRYGENGALVLAGEDLIPSGEVCKRMSNIIRRAKQLASAFQAGAPSSDVLVRAAINLAHCDTYYRVGRIDERFGKPTRLQVSELVRMLELVDWSVFRAKRLCLLNPTFGTGSVLVGGADADLLLDDMLIDVKTTATLRIRTEDWRQLIGYAALNEHFPIGDAENPVAIRRLGFYFARHGYLVAWPLDDLVDRSKFSTFARWLRGYLKRAHAERQARRKTFEQEMRRLALRRARRGKQRKTPRQTVGPVGSSKKARRATGRGRAAR